MNGRGQLMAAQAARILSLQAEGLSTTAIAERLGVPVARARRILKRHGRELNPVESVGCFR